MPTSLLVVALVMLAGCGGGTTTIIERSVTGGVSATGNTGTTSTSGGDPVQSLSALLEQVQRQHNFTTEGYKHSDLISAGFVNRLDNEIAKARGQGLPGLDFDPFLCSQQLPVRISYEPAKVSGNTATVITHHDYGGPQTHTVTYEMQLVGGTWRLAGTDCLK